MTTGVFPRVEGCRRRGVGEVEGKTEVEIATLHYVSLAMISGERRRATDDQRG